MTADPGKPPRLAEGWGYLSFSHCSDAILLGWSDEKLGVDIERTDRTFEAQAIANRFFNKKEIEILSNLNKENMRLNVLEHWVVKEAAIKWQRGKLIQGLIDWSWDKKNNIAINRRLNYKLNINQLKYKEWHIAISSNKLKSKCYPMICINSN